MFPRSARRLGPVGFHASFSRVWALEPGRSHAAKGASQPKCAGASSGARETAWHVQPPGDGFGNLFDGDTLFGDRMISRAWGGFFQRQAVQQGDVKPVGRGPAIEAIADVCGNSFFAGDRDGISDQALLYRVMNLGEPHDDDGDAASGDRGGGFLGSCARDHRGGDRWIVFGGRQAGMGA